MHATWDHEPRPCWTCAWFGYLGHNGHGVCVRPHGSPLVALPAQGCAFWTREPGTDDGDARPPAIAEESRQAVAVRAERARLVRIHELASRVRMPGPCWANCADRSGRLEACAPVLLVHLLPEAQKALQGLNAAIDAGRL